MKMSTVQDVGLRPNQAIGTIHIVRDMKVKRVSSKNVHESVVPFQRHSVVGCEVGRTEEERFTAYRSFQTIVRVNVNIIQRTYERSSVRGSNIHCTRHEDVKPRIETGYYETM